MLVAIPMEPIWLMLMWRKNTSLKVWGNGAGMRVSPVGLYAKTLDETLAIAAVTAAVTHNHPEGG